MENAREVTPLAPSTAQGPASGGASGGEGASAARAQSGEFVQLSSRKALQFSALTGMASGRVHQAASDGIGGSGGSMPHLDAIQASFGNHDIGGVRAHTDSAASQANEALGAEAYATGNDVAFASSSPSLHTAAHEAAHVVQQRGGVQLKSGIGSVGDAYEQHADAVADQVVQGKSAEGLLNQMAPTAAAPSGGAVQAKVVQFDIKSDLRSAMSGWGTDEDAIFNRLRQATAAELQAVVADAGLMNELRDDLSHDEMVQVLDLVQAPLATKLRLAMDGWGTDEAYIHRSLLNASAAELQAIAADTAMVARLRDELSGDDIRQVLDRLNLPLSGKLRYAVEGWGTDEDYLFRSIESAPIAEVQAVAADSALMAAVDGDLSGADMNRWRGTMAKRLWVEATDGLGSFKCVDDDSDTTRQARLDWLGPLPVQQAMLDAEIAGDNNAPSFIHAFQSYWRVEIGATDGATMSQWPVPVLRQMHAQLKMLPPGDTRAGFWTRLTLSDASLIDATGRDVGLRNRAAWGGGDFTVGTQASTTSNTEYGYGTTLTAEAVAGQPNLTVQEGDRLAANSAIKIDRGTADEEVGTIASISGSTWTLTANLAKRHATGALVVPNDDTASRQVNWLDATVRHEIAHGIDENLGTTVQGFTVGLGGWWTGTSFDDWAGQMANPWGITRPAPAAPAPATGGPAPAAATTLTQAEKDEIKAAIVDAVTNQKGSLYGPGMGLAATHAAVVHRNSGIPVIDAAEVCLSRGDGFFRASNLFHRSNGKGFSVSFWYKKFMYFNESIIGERVKDYGLFAPTEFFAEAYTVYYEEAGRVPEASLQLGRLIRNTAWRDWITTNIHNRGQAPASGGTTGTGSPTAEATAAPAAASRRGRKHGDPGP